LIYRHLLSDIIRTSKGAYQEIEHTLSSDAPLSKPTLKLACCTHAFARFGDKSKFDKIMKII
jgi:hypothetical protein